MKNISFVLAAAFCVIAMSTLTKAQVPILYYDFENNTVRSTNENLVEQEVNAGFSGPLTVTTPGGAVATGAAGAGRYRNNNAAAAQGGGLSTGASPNWASTVTTDPGTGATAYYEFTVYTLGFTGMSIEFDSRASSTGPSRVGILYSTDGGSTFTSAGILQNTGFSATAPPEVTSWTTNVFDLSAITALDQAFVTIRIYAFAGTPAERAANNSQGGAATTGTFRVDNVAVRAEAAVGSNTLLDYPDIGLSLRSGFVAFTPTYSDFAVNSTAITVTLASDLILSGVLAFNFDLGNIDTGVNTLIITSAGTVNRTSGHVIGNLRKTFTAAGSKTFEVGTSNGYSPVEINVTAGTFPADFTVSAVQSPHPAFTSPQFALQRYWAVTAPADMTLDLTFNYIDPDVPGTANEADFVVYLYDGSFEQLGGTLDEENNIAIVSGVATEGGGTADFTLAHDNAPTAADGRISGRTVDSNGAPISGAVIYLNGTQNRKFISDANGYYHFDKVETTGFYTVTPSRANYGFSPGSRSFSQLGNNTEAAFTAVANGQTRNPLDTPEYFVRQHYLDFLGREPDEAGFNFWSDQILECAGDAACIERRTVNVSAAYFLSVEFQETGGLVDRLYKASYGRSPLYAEFMPDSATIARGVVVGRSGWQELLAANKEAFVAGWTERANFRAAFDNLSDADYVQTLLSHTGVSFTPTERDALVNGLSNATLSRADVLEQIANNENFARARFNEAFVMMEYFGYLRRDPDASGYQFWLDKLNQFDGNFERAEMVKAFIVSGEYRARFQR